MGIRHLSSLQLSTLRRAPREWNTLEDMNAWGPTIRNLAKRGLVEVRKLDTITQWRRKPLTFEDAVKRLCDLLPITEQSLASYHAAEELREVRQMLDEFDRRRTSHAINSGSVVIDGGMAFERKKAA